MIENAFRPDFLFRFALFDGLLADLPTTTITTTKTTTKTTTMFREEEEYVLSV